MESISAEVIPINGYKTTKRYTQRISVSSHRDALSCTRSIIDRLPNVNTISLSNENQLTRKSSLANRRQLNNLTVIVAPRHRRHTVQHPSFSKHQGLSARLGRVLTDTRLHKQTLRILFRRIIRLVQVLCRVCIAIRRYAVNKNDNRALAEFQNLLRPAAIDNLPDVATNNGPYFNKHVYSVQNNHTFPAWARILCSQPSKYRKEEDLIKLRSYLRGHTAFAHYDYDTQIVICRNILYNRYDKKRIILSQGDNSEYYYIMISGSVYVNISHRDANTGIEITETVDELRGHCSFGATGLMYQTKRTASVVSDSFVEVLLIDSKVFEKYCSDILMKEHEKQKLFLHSHEVFKTWSNVRIKLLSYDIKCCFYRPHKVIDIDAVTSKYIYFVIDGSVDVFYKNDSDKNSWLHSTELNRHVGVLAGNRIWAPNPCNLTTALKQGHLYKDLLSKIDYQEVKILLISNGATILYVPRTRFQDVAPKNFLKSFEARSEFLYLSNREYERERRKAVKWMEFRNKISNDTVKFPAKKNDVIIPKLIR